MPEKKEEKRKAPDTPRMLYKAPGPTRISGLKKGVETVTVLESQVEKYEKEGWFKQPWDAVNALEKGKKE